MIFVLASNGVARAQVVINEIHYHPVENPAFDAAGNPLLDLTEDVHEFVELHNAGSAAVDLSGWELSGAISFNFPAGTTIPAGGYKVVAKNPARLQTVYGATGVLGPYSNWLSNKADTVKVKDGAGTAVDSVSYSSTFPWPGTADGLGADQDFTLINRAPYQYKGRSLERFSATYAGNAPENWLASPLASGPTPGGPNTARGLTPKPIVTAFSVGQLSDEAPVIRQNQAVRVIFTFSPSAPPPSGLEIQYFREDVNSFTEARNSIAATDVGNGVFSATLPGQLDRSVVRWRIRANFGAGLETVSPRPDDVALVPTAATV
ncbi:MAG TPA: lamin tail domain-containing protein, partial [Chthoniobacteraceae bacterium]